MITKDTKEIIGAGLYRHYKGDLYEVVGTVVHSETLEELVLYRSIKGSDIYDKETLWVRPKNMFVEFLLIGGKAVRRFSKIEDHHTLP